PGRRVRQGPRGHRGRVARALHRALGRGRRRPPRPPPPRGLNGPYRFPMPLLALSLAALAALAGAWGYRQTTALRQREAAYGELAEAHAQLEKVYGELRAEVAARAARQAEVTDELQATLDHLRETRGQLLESRRLASLGQLTAGIAHEIKNPLNFVNNFGRLSVELAGELREELEANPERPVAEVLDEVGDVLGDLVRNAAKITEHGARAD